MSHARVSGGGSLLTIKERDKETTQQPLKTMLMKIKFAFLCLVLLYHLAASFPVDDNSDSHDNAIADKILRDYFDIEKDSGM